MLGRFLDEHLFRPLGMTDTAFYLPADKVKRLAQPLATDRATGKPIVLHDVTVPPKNDAGGAGGTAFWVDPKEQLVAVLMTQAQPGPWQREFRELFRQLVYQAIVD